MGAKEGTQLGVSDGIVLGLNDGVSDVLGCNDGLAEGDFDGELVEETEETWMRKRTMLSFMFFVDSIEV